MIPSDKSSLPRRCSSGVVSTGGCRLQSVASDTAQPGLSFIRQKRDVGAGPMPAEPVATREIWGHLRMMSGGNCTQRVSPHTFFVKR